MAGIFGTGGANGSTSLEKSSGDSLNCLSGLPADELVLFDRLRVCRSGMGWMRESRMSCKETELGNGS